MCLDVLLQVILAPETLIAHRAAEGAEARVDSLVPGELLVAGEGLAAVRVVALEGTLAWREERQRGKLLISLISLS